VTSRPEVPIIDSESLVRFELIHLGLSIKVQCMLLPPCTEELCGAQCHANHPSRKGGWPLHCSLCSDCLFFRCRRFGDLRRVDISHRIAQLLRTVADTRRSTLSGPRRTDRSRAH
jgi:hypothetical protein